MITREEYLNALEIVDKYHRQNQEIEVNKKMLIVDWIRANDHRISVRLLNSLKAIQYYNNRVHESQKLIFMDQLDRFAFKKIRGAGTKTWVEFDRFIINEQELTPKT